MMLEMVAMLTSCLAGHVESDPNFKFHSGPSKLLGPWKSVPTHLIGHDQAVVCLVGPEEEFQGDCLVWSQFTVGLLGKGSREEVKQMSSWLLDLECCVTASFRLPSL